MVKSGVPAGGKINNKTTNKKGHQPNGRRRKPQQYK